MAPSTRPRRISLGTSIGPAFRVEARGQARHLFEDFYHSVLRWPWSKFLAFIIGAFMLVNAVFALLYAAVPGAIANARPGSFEDAFFFSVQTLATIGYGGMAPATLFGHVVVTIEAITGVLGITMMTGLMFSKFARPTARVLFSERVVVTPRNGVPHLMFRMANWRRNTVVEATLRVILLVEEVTLEGDVMRRPLEVPLVRDRNPMFSLTWNAMHRIDEASPFYGEAALERLRATNADIILSLSGVDENYGQTIYARHSYSVKGIVWNARFADVLALNDEGVRVIDYGRFHEVEPVAPATMPAAAPKGSPC